jgi:hypothetical protein
MPEVQGMAALVPDFSTAYRGQCRGKGPASHVCVCVMCVCVCVCVCAAIADCANMSVETVSA